MGRRPKPKLKMPKRRRNAFVMSARSRKGGMHKVKPKPVPTVAEFECADCARVQEELGDSTAMCANCFYDDEPFWGDDFDGEEN